ncbi:hypothetical protein PYW07_001192 [Mythimna separata]|uniref:Uncharacterized protein n=1 Tax=Mythimna separata TaxID=271217 RepID=A0AAD7YTC7_MYTSE|nr:hypothetical protein PYW07_001192 [Mythimna separata]
MRRVGLLKTIHYQARTQSWPQRLPGLEYGVTNYMLEERPFPTSPEVAGIAPEGYRLKLSSTQPPNSLRGVSVICYVDNMRPLAQRPSQIAAAEQAILGVTTVFDRIQQLGIEVALHKYETMRSHGLRNLP